MKPSSLCRIDREVVTVTRENFIPVLSHLVSLLNSHRSSLSFIALDAEFTGLGPNQANTRNQNIAERYAYLRDVVNSHALLSLGLSFFYRTRREWHPNPDVNNIADCYTVQNYSFLLVEEGEVTMSAGTGAFLVSNSFDFNALYSKGIPFRSGDDSDIPSYSHSSHFLRAFFETLLRARRPIVVHNGLMDLMFIYKSFYASLPDSITAFASHLHDMFPAGVYDTKHIVTVRTNEQTSFLGSVFKKCERYQQLRFLWVDSWKLPFIHCRILSICPMEDAKFTYRSQGDWAFLRRSASGTSNYDSTDPMTIATKPTDDTTTLPFCERFARFGHCPRKPSCPLSHNLDVVLDTVYGPIPSPIESSNKEEDKSNKNVSRSPIKNKKQKERVYAADSSDSEGELDSLSLSTEDEDLSNQPGTEIFSVAHSAAYDAFMTGYVFASIRLALDNPNPKLNHPVDNMLEILDSSDYEKSLGSRKGKDDVRNIRGIRRMRNRLYLMSKPLPLLVTHSRFVRKVSDHNAKIKRIMSDQEA